MLQFNIMEMKSINNYKCPACGGGLTFNPTAGKVVCEYCDSSFTIQEIEQIYAQPQNQQSDSEVKDDDKPTVEADGFDSSDGDWNLHSNDDWGAESSQMKEYNCPSCGANLICEQTTAATSCPYCGNPTVIETQFAGNLKPDYIIPFKIQKKEAVAALKEFYKGKKLLAKEFSDENHLEEVKGIYTPFWLFNGTAEGSLTFRTTTTHVSRHGNTETTTTRYFDCIRDGKIDFKNIPVDASEKMPDDMMDSLEPFNMGELTEFSTAYLPGYLADKYDVTIEQCTPRANNRCANTFVSEMEKTVVGYDSKRLTEKNINLRNGTVNYALMPVYLLYTKWKDQKFLFAVNGQTGKVVGDLPISKKLSFFYYLKNMIGGLLIGGALGFIARFVIKMLFKE